MEPINNQRLTFFAPLTYSHHNNYNQDALRFDGSLIDTAILRYYRQPDLTTMLEEIYDT